MKRIIIAVVFLTASLAAAQSSPWTYSSKTDIYGKVIEKAESGFSTSGGLIISCKTSCEIYFVLPRGEVADKQSQVLIKFNSGKVQQYGVVASEDSRALFFQVPLKLIKAIRDNGGYMTIQYEPYEKIAEMNTLEVWNMPAQILARIK